LSIQIEYLVDHADAVPLLAQWHYAEWNHLLPGWTYDEAVTDLRRHTGRRTVPTTLVAIEDSLVIGSASLLVDDLVGWEHLSPWVASVYVVPERRGQGVGRLLVTRATEEARELGFSAVFLWTARQRAFYERLGWKEIVLARQGRPEVAIMQRVLRG